MLEHRPYCHVLLLCNHYSSTLEEILEVLFSATLPPRAPRNFLYEKSLTSTHRSALGSYLIIGEEAQVVLKCCYEEAVFI